MFRLKRPRIVRFEKVNFRKFFEESRKLMIFLPEDKLDAYLVVEHLQSWFEYFAEIIYFAPAFQINFLRKLKQKKLANISDIRVAKGQHKNAVILYLNDVDKQVKYLEESGKSLILAPQDSQLEFFPKAETNVGYLKQVSSIFGRKFEPTSSRLALSTLGTSHKMLMQNKFPNFVLHMVSAKDRTLKSLVLFLKNQFSANIHFSANSCKMKDIPNIKSLEGVDLLQLCVFAETGDMLITDDSGLHNLLKELNLKSILIEDINDLTSLKARISSRLKGMS